MRVLVCGGRDYSADDAWNWLERFGHQDVAEKLGLSSYVSAIDVVIHGGARGADEGAARWGESEGVKVIAFPANWKKHGKAAGPLRNAKMLREGKPECVIAFPGGRGTEDMIRRSEEVGVPVIRVGH